jgi:myosin-5
MEAQYQPGATIFVPSEQDGWVPLTVVECRGFGDNLSLRATTLGSPESAARTLEKEELAQVQESDPLAIDGAPDLVKFSKLSESTLLHNLRVRYARDDIYTRAGAILLSVNPFKPLSIYTPERMAECKARPRPATS